MIEIWKGIAGFPNYQISSYGNIRCTGFIHRRSGITRLRKPVINVKNGYLYIMLSLDKKKYAHSVHRLVATTFIKNNSNKREVNHKNGIKTDNRVDNLEWMSSSENKLHRFKVLGQISNRRNAFNDHPLCRKVDKLHIETMSILESYPSISEAARQNNIGDSPICACLSGRSKSSAGFKWQYSK